MAPHSLHVSGGVSAPPLRVEHAVQGRVEGVAVFAQRVERAAVRCAVRPRAWLPQR